MGLFIRGWSSVAHDLLISGVIGYIYPNDDPGLTSDFNIWEIYGKAGLDLPLSPELAIYYDLDKVKGAYIEGNLSHSLAASERVSIDLGATAGFSAGQDADFDRGILDHTCHTLCERW